jgi:hypothetical protein
MKTINPEIDMPESDDFIEVDSFSTSIAPVNTSEKLSFSFRERACCAAFFGAFIAVMRLLLSN